MDTVLLKLLPVRAPKELFLCASGSLERPRTGWNYPDYVALHDQNRSFSGLAAASFSAMALGMQIAESDAPSNSELTYALMVSGTYFPVLGVNAEIERTKTHAGPPRKLQNALFDIRWSWNQIRCHVAQACILSAGCTGRLN